MRRQAAFRKVRDCRGTWQHQGRYDLNCLPTSYTHYSSLAALRSPARHSRSFTPLTHPGQQTTQPRARCSPVLIQPFLSFSFPTWPASPTGLRFATAVSSLFVSCPQLSPNTRKAAVARKGSTSANLSAHHVIAPVGSKHPSPSLVFPRHGLTDSQLRPLRRLHSSGFSPDRTSRLVPWPPAAPGSMPKSRRKRTRAPKTALPDDEGWYSIKGILDERKASGRVEYLVDWENDIDTGEQYPPSWISVRLPLTCHKAARLC